MSGRAASRWSAVLAAMLLIPVVGVGGADADTQPISQPYAVTMTASSNPVAPGSSLTYTITTTNSEPQVANVRLSDQINGLSNLVLTSSRGYCSQSSNLVSCQGGDMPGQGSAWVVTITGTVVGGSGTALSNTATVNGDWSAQNTSHDFTVNASTNVQIGSPAVGQLADLATSLSGPTSVAPNGNAIYQLTVSNFGFVKASDIFVSATLPKDWGLQSGQSFGTSLFNCTAATLPNITCTGGALNAGANATITIPAVAPAAPGTYKLTAAVDPENAISEPDDLQSNQNNFSQFAIAVPTGPAPTEPMTFTKTALSTATPGDGTQIRPGDILTYKITASNTSTKQTATRVQISDGTQGLDQASVKAVASDPKLTCTNSNNLATCMSANNGYTLATSSSVTVTITGRVVQPAATIITNTATLQTLQNKVSITRNASVTTIVRPPVDLSVTQFSTCSQVSLLAGTRGACQPFRARNQFDYLITVGNSGLDDAKNVLVREVLPADVIYEGFDDISGAGFSCTEGSPLNANPTTVTCTGGTIPGALSAPASYGGNTRQIRLHLTAPNSVGTISSTVYVDPYNQIAENDETNNTFTTATPIATGVNLTIGQTVRCVRDTRALPTMCDPAAPSGTIIYDILVQNVGTQDASSIKVSDILPPGARFRSAKEIATPAYTFGVPYTPVHNVSCTSSNGQVDCTGGRVNGSYAAYGGPKLHLTGTPDGFVIEVTAFAPAPYGPSSSPSATGSPILNQVSVDPDNTIPEFVDTSSPATDNLNILETNVGIPPLGDWGTFNELTVTNKQVNPVDGSGNALPVAPNGTLDYDLTVSNYGSDPASNIVVSDVFPTGARFRDVTADPLTGNTGGFGCTFNNGVLTCANGALAQAPSIGTPKSTVIHIRLFAPPVLSDATTHYTNHAVVDPGNAVAEADETNNISDVGLTVTLPDAGGKNAYNELSITNQQSNPSSGAVAPNGTLEYTLTAKNTGSDLAQNVTVYDYVPQGARFRNVTVSPYGGAGTSGGFLCSFSSGLVTCNSGTLAGGGSATIKVLLFSPETPSSDTQHYTNHVVIDPSNAIAEADENNNAADTPLTVTIGGGNPFNELNVVTSQSFPTSNGAVAPGGTVRYLLTVTNTGSDMAFQVPVRDYLPAGTTFRKARLLGSGGGTTAGVTGFVCTHNSGIVDCTSGTLPSGGVAVIEIVLFAPSQPSNPGSEDTISNQAVVDGGNSIAEADETNNTSTLDTQVALGGAGAYWDLTLADNGSDQNGTPDDPTQWTIDVTNKGTDDLFNAVVKDTLPAGVTFVAAGEADGTGPGRFSCTESGGVVTCTGGTVKGTVSNGGTPGMRTIHFAVKAPHANVGMINQVVADPANSVVEADETNNAIRLNTIIQSVIDLTITLDSASIAQGSAGHILGHITNTPTGGSGEDAHNVLSVWNLPVGVTVIDTKVPANTSCSTATDDTANQVTCITQTLSPGSPLDFDFYVYQNSDQTDNDNAVINGDNGTVESDGANNTSQSTVSQ